MPTGQRLVTALGYLTTVADGGGTQMGRMVVPALQGRLLIFHNCEPGTTDIDLASRHAGLPVGSGEKWAFNLWFKEHALSSSIEAAHRASQKGFSPAWAPS
jgi:prolyl 4-hydroxylase